MYGSFTYAQSEYAGLTLGNRSPYYLPVFEVFTLSEILAKGGLTKTITEVFTISENTNPSRTRTFLEEFTINETVRPVLNGQTAIWIRIPKNDGPTWINLPKN